MFKVRKDVDMTRLEEIAKRAEEASEWTGDMMPAVRQRHKDVVYLLAYIESQRKEIEALRTAQFYAQESPCSEQHLDDANAIRAEREALK